MIRFLFYLLIIKIFLLSLANTLVSPDEWKEFKLKYGKIYNTKESDELHLRNYELSKAECERNSKLFEKREVTFRMAINEYSDKRPDLEILNRLAKDNPELKKRPFFKTASIAATHPPGYKTYDDIVKEKLSIDWRQMGVVSPVGNQKDCNSCWAFSSTGALEAQIRIKQHKMINLSPKNLLDCSTNNHGCDGGWVRRAYEHIIQIGGIATKESYPSYRPISESCNYSPQYSAGTLTDLETLKMGDEQLMAEVVYNIGPVTASIDHRNLSFNNYKSGVYIEPSCKYERIDLSHSILVVGFGTDWIEGDYWIIKNSFGKEWGINGYMLMARNRNNMCGIASVAQYPIL